MRLDGKASQSFCSGFLLQVVLLGWGVFPVASLLFYQFVIVLSKLVEGSSTSSSHRVTEGVRRPLP